MSADLLHVQHPPFCGEDAFLYDTPEMSQHVLKTISALNQGLFAGPLGGVSACLILGRGAIPRARRKTAFGRRARRARPCVQARRHQGVEACPRLSVDAEEVALSTHGRAPVLLAVDQVNALFVDTAYNGVGGERLGARRLPTLSALRRFFEDTCSGGNVVALGATSFADRRLHASELGKSNPSLDAAPKGTTERLQQPQIRHIPESERNYSIIQAPAFDVDETKSLLEFYRAAGLTHTCTPD